VTTAFPDARTLLKRYGLTAKKSWGQNFLVSDRVYRAIVDATVSKNTDWIVEIGSGLGTLTMRLAERVVEGKVVAVERDPDMVAVLEAELGHLDNVDIAATNALGYDFHAIARWNGSPIAVCGNLPYQLASQLLFRVIEFRSSISRAVVMIQREMADRLVASAGTKAYGILTVLIGAYADIRTVIHAKPTAFVPAPKVDSTVIRLDMLASPRAPIPDYALFSKTVHAAFAQRRKTLRNALRAALGDEATDAALSESAIDGKRRGETLTIEEFAALTTAFAAEQGGS